jgi:hypothetical protein
MPVQVKKHHPALKHAGYAATGILPGENPAEFEKLHRDLIAELCPNGALENDVIATMARFVWRKKNLETFRIAELGRNDPDVPMRGIRKQALQGRAKCGNKGGHYEKTKHPVLLITS